MTPPIIKCADPDAPIMECANCGKPVHTCERETPVDNDYRCPVHKHECQLNCGLWVCSEKCYDALVEYDAEGI